MVIEAQTSKDCERLSLGEFLMEDFGDQPEFFNQELSELSLDWLKENGVSKFATQGQTVTICQTGVVKIGLSDRNSEIEYYFTATKDLPKKRFFQVKVELLITR